MCTPRRKAPTRLRTLARETLGRAPSRRAQTRAHRRGQGARLSATCCPARGRAVDSRTQSVAAIATCQAITGLVTPTEMRIPVDASARRPPAVSRPVYGFEPKDDSSHRAPTAAPFRGHATSGGSETPCAGTIRLRSARSCQSRHSPVIVGVVRAETRRGHGLHGSAGVLCSSEFAEASVLRRRSGARESHGSGTRSGHRHARADTDGMAKRRTKTNQDSPPSCHGRR